MAHVWVCSICFVFTSVTIRSLVRHITVAHASKPNFKIKCVIPGCPTEYTKINSLRTHLRRRHKQICVDTPVEDHQSEDNHINDDQGEYDTSSSEDENSDSCLVCILLKQYEACA